VPGLNWTPLSVEDLALRDFESLEEEANNAALLANGFMDSSVVQWTFSMDTMLLEMAKTSEKTAHLWNQAAQKIKSCFVCNITEDECLAEYELILAKRHSYQEVFEIKMTEVQKNTSPKRMQWKTLEEDHLLRSVVERWKSIETPKKKFQGGALWDKITQEMNQRLDVTLTAKSYQDRYRRRCLEPLTQEYIQASCEKEVSFIWTAAMDITLLEMIKESEATCKKWDEIAQKAQDCFGHTVTGEQCQMEYAEILSKVRCYHEVFNIKQAAVERQTHKKDVEWTKENLQLLKEVTDTWKAKLLPKRNQPNAGSLWEKIAQDMNQRLGARLIAKSYQDKYRFLSHPHGKLTAQEKKAIIKEMQTGNYYKFSEAGIFMGIAYAKLAKVLEKNEKNIRRLVRQSDAKNSIYLQEIQSIEKERCQGQIFSKDEFYMKMEG
jgi:hypothetical protein